MEEALRTRLLATAALAALVGRRIDWGVRAQGASGDALTLNRISSVPSMNLAGAGAWSEDRIQFDAWAKTYAEARNIIDTIALREAPGSLHGKRFTLDGIRFRTWVIDRDNGTDSSTTGVDHSARMDLRVWWSKLTTGD